jgi:nucleotide-binding universal stress UspA family protein
MNNVSEVVACIDGSRYSDAVCDYAAWMSIGLKAPLTLLHNIEHATSVTTSEPDFSGTIGLGSKGALLDELTSLEAQRSRLLLEQGKFMLNAASKRATLAGASSPRLRQRHDGLTESLIELEDNIRVLVLGIRGEEHERDEQHLGSHLESSIRALHRPILVVNSDFQAPKQVMLAYDGSDASGKALHLLVQSQRFALLPIHLVTVGESESDAAVLQSKAMEKLTSSGHQVKAATLDGDPGETLLAYQVENDIDMTLMGAFSHTRLREWVLGSLTVKMLLSSNRPLLLLK